MRIWPPIKRKRDFVIIRCLLNDIYVYCRSSVPVMFNYDMVRSLDESETGKSGAWVGVSNFRRLRPIIEGAIPCLGDGLGGHHFLAVSQFLHRTLTAQLHAH